MELSGNYRPLSGSGERRIRYRRCFMGIITMFHLRHSPSPSFLATRCARAAFSLIEIVVALAVLGTMSGGAYIGFSAINQYSVSSRLYSQAQTVAQNQIDLILSEGPFDPNVNPPKIPAVLALGDTVKNNVFIYTDPQTDEVLVRGKMTTTVTDTGNTMTLEGATTKLNLRHCTVRVTYTYRNTNYLVALDTMRTADR